MMMTNLFRGQYFPIFLFLQHLDAVKYLVSVSVPQEKESTYVMGERGVLEK